MWVTFGLQKFGIFLETKSGFRRTMEARALSCFFSKTLPIIRLRSLDIVKSSFGFAPIRSDLATRQQSVKDVDERFPVDAKPGDQVFLANAVLRGNRGEDFLGGKLCRTALDATPKEEEAQLGVVGRGVDA